MAAAPTSDDFSRRSGHTNIAPCVCAFERERGFFVRFDSFFLSIEVARFLFFIFSWTFSLFFWEIWSKNPKPFHSLSFFVFFFVFFFFFFFFSGSSSWDEWWWFWFRRKNAAAAAAAVIIIIIIMESKSRCDSRSSGAPMIVVVFLGW